SSRRNVTTFTMSSLIALIVSSPLATRYPVSEPASAPAMVSPSLSSLSSIARLPSALDRAGAADLLLQQQYAVDECLGGRWAAGGVDIERQDAIAAAHDQIEIMVIAPTVRARAHRNHVARLRHLIVDLAQSGRHFVGKRPRHDHHIRLPRGGAR